MNKNVSAVEQNIGTLDENCTGCLDGNMATQPDLIKHSTQAKPWKLV